MNTKFFKPLFITLFLTAFSFGLKAQEDKAAQYEIATVTLAFNGGGARVTQTNSSKPFEDIPLTKGDSFYKEYLQVVQNLVNQGWKIESVIPLSNSAYYEKYILKRKLK
ncbi:MAG TPA: hypothetical protein VGB95_05960 [Chitinophagales bacterium]